ncbi:MAG: peptidoglycan-binding domain-containing protein [Pseudomonadota bacterium]
MAHKTVKKAVTSVVAASMMFSAAHRAHAGAQEVIIGTALICILNPKACGGGGKRPGNTRPKLNAAQVAANKEVQNSLNTFGFPVGRADGVLGRKSRAAIGDYQRYMGYPATGRLSDWERNTLVGAWRKYQGGWQQQYAQTINAEGPRAMLKIERDPNYASKYDPPAIPMPVPATHPMPKEGDIIAPSAEDFARAESKKLGPLTPLPSVGVPAKSVAARCELVAAATQIQGGVMRADAITDHDQALSEKLCEARGFAITQGQSTQSGVQVSEAELTGTCERIKAAFDTPITRLPSEPVQSVIANVKAVNSGLGLTDPGIVQQYGEICLGIGYRSDDAQMALAVALSMTAGGFAAYGELVGHHLREGFGTKTTSSASVNWYAAAMSALENGSSPVFAASTTPDRIMLIRNAMQIVERQAGLQVVPVGETWVQKN